jgi:hypothetical protein
MVYLAYRERKDKTPGKRKLDMKNFLREEGTKTVTSPLTGEKVKIKTLTGPTYQEDQKSKDFLNKLFQEWREKNRGKEDEAPKEEESTPEAPVQKEPESEVKAPPAEAPEVKAPEVKAPEVKAPPVEAPFPGEKEPETPSSESKSESPSDSDKGAPVKPSEVAPEAAPAKPSAPEPEGLEGDPTQPSQQKPKPNGPQAPDPDLDASPEDVAKAVTTMFQQGEPDLIVQFFQEREKALREWAGEKPDKDKDKDKVELGLKRVSEEAQKLLEKNGLSMDHGNAIRAFSQKQEQDRKELFAPKEDVKKRHQIQDDDEKAVGRIVQSLGKKHQSNVAKYNKAKRQYDAEKADYDKASGDVQKSHDAVKAEIAATKLKGDDGEWVTIPKETFDEVHSFASRKLRKFENTKAKWEKQKQQAEETGDDPPPEPQPPDIHTEWLKDHKKKWEGQPEATRGEYQPPMVSPELFQKIQAAPTMPKAPAPLGDPPEAPTAKSIRQEIEDNDPDLAEKFKDVSDADFETLIGPVKTKSVAEMKAEFLDTIDDPEFKKRVQEMDPDDLEALFAALNSKKGKGKRGSLVERTIRLAYARPDLREHLLAALSSNGGW